ncbi:alanine racemase [Sphingomonas oryzagri]|uniref:Alanine racemase n=1 Tax=Sphingomonas oryzagri TaxID=3042314 RepID=A0ABT6MYC3_9SPHN|nr:alanine racemase [Sphingomonas oryzagri]MDH7637131.1 alanine racemase [Sphingomonas oryzagri]
MSQSVPAALRLTIDGDALAANWRWLRARGGEAACGAAVKANGYGLGARGVVERLAREGCRDFFVSNWAEAAALGPMPEGATLSVLHGVREADMPAALSGMARPVLNSAEHVARWKAAGGGVCDVMIDTGMNRLGLRPEEAGVLDGLAIETLLSHLACADEPDHPMNARQLAAFRQVHAAIPAKRYSLANSAGICLGAPYAFDLTRPGLALYGGVPVPDDASQKEGLRSAALIEAEVIQVRDVEEDESVGYGATWIAGLPCRVAILNVGYADGYLRGFSNIGSWRSRDATYPVIGRVSMDLVAIQVGREVREGDWMALDQDLPALARMSGLSQYELLTTLGHRYQRRWT